MGQIVKGKKKGRPSKADLAARRAAAAEQSSAGGGASSPARADETQQQRDLRRSLRRRSFRYNIIDYDEDYLDDNDEVEEELFADEDDEDVVAEEEEDEEEDERRREKKVKLVVKLNNGDSSSHRRRRSRDRSDSAGRPSRIGRVRGADSDESDEEQEEEEEERRKVKKRRISNGGGGEEEEDYDEERENGGNDDGDDEGRDDDKGDSKTGFCAPGTPTECNRSETPLPDKKQLELVLDKLQKKDTYGVYAEPVDPEELPDYHDVIEHPMDFSTVRKKLANGSYSTLEQFESDVFLICSNAMTYNAPETIYHKQARTIKELAEKKFQRIRIRIERLEKEPKCEPKSEPKSEQQDRSYSLVKKQTKKPLCRSLQEPVGSDFSSGATLATTDAHNTSGADHAGKFERPGSNDGPIEGISSQADNNAEKAEDPQSAKCVLPKFWRKSFVVDENRRATYSISNLPVDRSESIFTPFEGEKKQLIPVGLPGEYSYARSLARFAANLGPVAWNIASKRIEQVLPPGFKYGRGWIGEYEPLPTALVVLEGRKEYPLVSRSRNATDSQKTEKLPECRAPAKAQLFNQPSSDAKPSPMYRTGGVKPPTPPASVSQQRNPLSRGSGGPENMTTKRVELNCVSANNQKNNAVFQQQNRLPRDTIGPEEVRVKSVEPNSPTISNQKPDYVVQKQPSCGTERGRKRVDQNPPSISNHKGDHAVQERPPADIVRPASRPVESNSNGKHFLQSLPFKQPDASAGAPEGLPNRKIINNSVDNNRVMASSAGLIPTQLAGAPVSFPQRQDQGLSDPVLVMKMVTEKAQKQQNGLIVHGQSPSQPRPSVPSPRGGDSGSNAAAAAASAWMSVGAVGYRPAAQSQNPATNRNQVSDIQPQLYNATRVFYPQAMHSHVEYPVSASMQFQAEKKGFPFQAFAPQGFTVGSNETHVQNRPTVMPQLVMNDMSRFPVQAPWRGLSPHTQQNKKQDSLPPDLNVAFQSVDSQQPDLALQL